MFSSLYFLAEEQPLKTKESNTSKSEIVKYLVIVFFIIAVFKG
jgi:hypothetical protein